MGLFGLGTKRQLLGKRIAILATEGVEQIELTSPRKALEKAGAVVELVSPHKILKGGKIKAWNLVKWGDLFKIDATLSDAKVSSYDGLHLPGGVINPDILRMDSDAVDCAQLLRSRQTCVFDLSRPLDAHRSQRRSRQNIDIMALVENRPPERRGALGQ